jgi:hypothetical protein
MEIDPSQVSDDQPLTDWLLRQREIVVHDALITWDDDQRNAPQLVLDRVQFRLENRFGRHRFGLRGTPPAELASPLDLRGDLALGSMRDWQNAQGTVFVRLDYADVAAWREWLPLPAQIASGTGALRIWFQFAGSARDHRRRRARGRQGHAAGTAGNRARASVGPRRRVSGRRARSSLARWPSPLGGDALDPTELALVAHGSRRAHGFRQARLRAAAAAPLA